MSQLSRHALAIEPVVAAQRTGELGEQHPVAFARLADFGARQGHALGKSSGVRCRDRIDKAGGRHLGFERIPAFGRVGIGIGRLEMLRSGLLR